MPDPLAVADLGLRIVAAIVLGAAIGLERQWRLRTAGIRTNALVSIGAALFVIVGAAAWDEPTADPSRVAAQVVSGIGFLGAGVIIRDGLKIRGLTTAATLWCAAAVGSLAGAGMYGVAFMGAVAIVATNTLLRPLSRMVNRRMLPPRDAEPEGPEAASDYTLEFVTNDKNEARVRAMVLQALSIPELSLRSIHSAPAKDSRRKIVATVTASGSLDLALLEQVLHSLGLDPKVLSSRWWAVDPGD